MNVKAKNRQDSSESCRFYLLPITFPKTHVDFWKVIGNSENGRSIVQTRLSEFVCKIVTDFVTNRICHKR